MAKSKAQSDRNSEHPFSEAQKQQINGIISKLGGSRWANRDDCLKFSDADFFEFLEAMAGYYFLDCEINERAGNWQDFKNQLKEIENRARRLHESLSEMSGRTNFAICNEQEPKSDDPWSSLRNPFIIKSSPQHGPTMDWLKDVENLVHSAYEKHKREQSQGRTNTIKMDIVCAIIDKFNWCYAMNSENPKPPRVSFQPASAMVKLIKATFNDEIGVSTIREAVGKFRAYKEYADAGSIDDDYDEWSRNKPPEYQEWKGRVSSASFEAKHWRAAFRPDNQECFY